MFGSTTAKNRSLKACYGSAHSSAWSGASVTVHIYDGNPTNGGTELAGNGYAAITVANNDTNFPAPSAGRLTTAALTFPDCTGGQYGGAVGSWWVIKDGATLLDCAPLVPKLNASTAGSVPSILLEIF